jgi:squalene-associated FAD-dependent desaturase
MRIAVVGAGLAGLAAALELKELGAHVELFERSRLLGGRATSFEIEGHEVDNGQHVFLACCTEFVRFAQRVGMGDALYIQPRFDAHVIARDGSAGRLRAAWLPAPFHLLASFATYRHLSITGKLRVARALASALFGSIHESDTFEGWLVCAGQNAVTRRAFWDPFFIPALNAPFDCVGVADGLFTLKTAFLHDAGAARFGFSKVPLAHLAAAAAKQLDAVHLSTAVVGVDPIENGARVRLTLLDRGCAEFDAVVLAVPPRALGRMLGDPARFGVSDLDGYTPYPIVDVHLWHDGGALGFDFAAALESPLQWIFEKEPGYLCCSFSAADAYMRLPTSELEALAWEETKTFVPALRDATLLRSAVTRNPEATYVARPGMPRAPQQTSQSAVAIAGSWTDTGWPDTMESAVRSGLAAARVIHAARRPDVELREPASAAT